MSDLSDRISELSAAKLALLAQELRKAHQRAADPPAPAQAGRGPRPLSFAQWRLWFQEEMDAGTAMFNSALEVELSGPLSVRAMRQAFQEIVSRHAILRSAVVVSGAEPSLVVHDDAVPPFTLADLRQLPESDQPREIDRLSRECVRRPFDLGSPPLLRILLFRLEPRRHLLVVCIHHIVFDAWSATVLTREFARIYERVLNAAPASLPPLPAQYGDYAEWQRQRFRSGALDAQLAYWTRQLRLLPAVMDLPIDRPRPAVKTARGSVRTIHLDASRVSAVREFAIREGCTTFMVLVAAFQALLHRVAATDDVVVGTSVSDRDRTDWEALIGLFVNSLVLRVDASGDPPFRTFLTRVRTTVLEALSQREVPFDRVVDALKLERSLNRSPAFQVAFVLENTPHENIEVRGLRMRPRPIHNGSSVYDLFVLVEEGGEGLRVTAEYSSDLFDPDTVDSLLAQYCCVLWGGVQRPTDRLSSLPLLDPSESSAIVRDFNRTATGHRDEQCIHAVFEAHVHRDPGAIAVEDAHGSLSYGELNRDANRLARFLRRLGVGAEVLTAIHLPRSPELVATILAVLKAGGAYVYLDPEHPRDRLAAVLAASHAPVVVTRSELLRRLPTTWTRVVCLDVEQGNILGEDPGNLAAPVTPSNLAYVMYTSGTTGVPKGVMIEHDGVVGLARWQRRYFGVGPGRRISQLAAYSFDASVGETVMALGNGATLVLMDRTRLDAVSLPAAINERRIAVLVTVPSMLRKLDPARLVHGRDLTIVSVGEACPEELADRWSRHTHFVNAYGPTEYTVYSHAWRHRAGARHPKARAVPIGTPMSDTRSYILDAHFNPVPVGAVGEMYISGHGLARGYHGRPDLTAERFLANPFASVEEARPLQPDHAPQRFSRMYRTGDLARYLPDGSIEYCGRIDDQVKILGCRVEPLEVAAVLCRHGSLSDATVIARPDISGVMRLAAYVVPSGDRPGSAADADDLRAELRRFLHDRLPQYMVPSDFVVLQSLPLTPNGKIDNSKLPQPSSNLPARAMTAPRSPMERRLALAWKEVLRIDDIGVDDNIFELGADSIAIVQVVSALNREGLQVTVEQFFRHQSIAGLAAVVEPQRPQARPAEPDDGPVPLTPIQTWFLEQRPQEPFHYNQSVLLVATEPIEPGRMKRAVAAVLTRHDALRLRVTGHDGRWDQCIARDAGECFSAVDVSAVRPDDWPASFTAVMERLHTSLDLANGPVFRAALFDCGAHGAARLFMTAHHLAVDALSWPILVSDLERAYREDATAQTLGSPAASFQAWARSLERAGDDEDLAEDRRYWQRVSSEAAAPLPRDDATGINTEGAASTVSLSLGRDETKAFSQRVPRASGARPLELLTAAVVAACRDWTGEPRVLLDLEGHGRGWAPHGLDVSRTVGWLTSLCPVSVDVGTTTDVHHVLDAVQEALRAIPKGGAAIGVVRDSHAAGHSGDCALPKAEISLNYISSIMQGATSGSLFTLAAGSFGTERSPRLERPYLLEVIARIHDDRLRIDLRHGSRIHRADTARGLLQGIAAHLVTLLSTDEGEAAYAITPMQHGILFHDLAAPGTGVYQNHMCFCIRGAFDEEAFLRAWHAVTARHPALRTEFAWQGLDAPRQRVTRAVTIPVDREDWSGLPRAEQRERLRNRVGAERRTGFDLSRAPLMRLFFARLGDDSVQVVWSFHHILVDGWSVAIILRDVSASYAAYTAGAQLELDPAPAFRPYVEWLASRDNAATHVYWRTALEGVTTPTPVPLAGPVRSHGQAPDVDEIEDTLSAAETAAVRTQALSNHWTLNTLVQGAWALVLAGYSCEREVIHGVTVSGRPPDLEGAHSTVGLFINTLPVRVAVDPRVHVRAWLDGLQLQLAEAGEHGHASLSDIQRWSALPRTVPLFETVVIVENYPLDAALRRAAGGLAIEDIVCLQQSNYPLTLIAVPGDELSIRLMYDRARLPAEAARQILRHSRHQLTQLAASVDGALGDVSLMTAAERHSLLVERNATRKGYPDDECIHDIFAATCERTPDAVAVECDGALTYRELNERANRLAHYLRRQGAGPEALVGILVSRSLEMYVGLLAILKAGAAYVPLDPAYPAERLGEMIADAKLPMILTERALAPRLGSFDGLPVLLDETDDVLSEPSTNPRTGVVPDNLAYVMYTSGSTGRPKGILGMHGSTLNAFYWMWERYPFHPGEVCCQKTALSFGDSIQEIFGPLLTGVLTIVIPDDVVRDPHRFVRRLAEARVTRIVLVPSLLRAMLEAVPDLGARVPHLTLWIASGEALPRDLSEQFAAWVPHALLVNMYGTSELSNDVTYEEAGPVAGGGGAPIGRPISNMEVYLLNDRLAPVPSLAPGEIFVGGRGLNRGYLGRPDLTAAAFMPHPFPVVPGARIYRTGDIGRLTSSGSLEYIGRSDQQIKLRGHRIELEEVATELDQHPAIEQSVVLARADAGGDRHLAAYILPTREQQLLQAPHCYRLPNGLPVLHHNKNETDFQYEEIFEDLAYTDRAIALDEGACVFDLGANIGMFTLWVHLHWPGARIFAFEPNPAMFALLGTNVELHRCRARLFPYAIADTAGTRSLTCYPQATLLTGMYADRQRDSAIFRAAAERDPRSISARHVAELAATRFEASQLDVPTRTLSDAMRDAAVDRIDLLKIDVERSELDVLRGLEPQDWNRIDQVVAEVEETDGRLEGVLALLSRHGFEVAVTQSERLKGTFLHNVYACRPGARATSSPRPAGESTVPRAADLSPDALRRFLSARLPGYMVPSTYCVVDRFPRTPSGKLDRQALSRIEGSRSAGNGGYEAPSSTTELELAAIWKEVLGVDRVGRRDNLFDMGAHSLLVITAHDRIRARVDPDVTIVDLYRYPTILELARRLSGEERDESAHLESVRRGAHRRQRAEQAARRSMHQ